MAKIKAFDRINLGPLRQDMEEALAKVAAAHGIKFSVGRISFMATTFKAEVTALVQTEETANPLLQGVSLADIAKVDKMALTAGKLLKKFLFSGREYIIVGFRGRSNLIVRKASEPYAGTFVLKLEFDMFEAVRNAY